MNKYYKHFKADPTPEDPFNGIYEVVGFAYDENDVKRVVYVPLYGNILGAGHVQLDNTVITLPKFYTQSEERFLGFVINNKGKVVQRFEPIHETLELKLQSIDRKL